MRTGNSFHGMETAGCNFFLVYGTVGYLESVLKLFETKSKTFLVKTDEQQVEFQLCKQQICKSQLNKHDSISSKTLLANLSALKRSIDCNYKLFMIIYDSFSLIKPPVRCRFVLDRSKEGLPSQISSSIIFIFLIESSLWCQHVSKIHKLFNVVVFHSRTGAKRLSSSHREFTVDLALARSFQCKQTNTETEIWLLYWLSSTAH